MKRFLVLCSLFLFLPVAGRAATSPFIGEVGWAGSNASTADEWFEICGPADTDVSGWSIDGAATGGATLALPAGSVVPASGAFLIGNYGADDPKSTLAVAPDFVTTAVALSNSALFLTLRDASGAVVDVASQSGKAPPAGTSGELKASMERLFPLVDGATPEAWTKASTSEGFDAGATELGTPGGCPTPIGASEEVEEEAPAPTETTDEPSSTPEPAPAEEAPAETPASEASTASADEAPVADATETPDVPPPPTSAIRPLSAVRISEAYPAPESGEREWIELVNPSDVGEVLDGWTIEDGKGAATPLSGTLLPWSRIVVESPKGQLNNDGDSIVLKDASGRPLDGAAYGLWDSAYPNVGDVRKGESLMRLELQDRFAVTTTPTPGNANVLTERLQKPAASEAEDAPARTSEIPVPAAASAPTMTARPAPVITPISTEIVRTASVEPKKMGLTTAVKKKAPAAKKPTASRYKGSAYVAVIASPPGVYSKTRMYALIDGLVREVRFSKAPGAMWSPGLRIAFVAQEKSDGADPYLLANPNSVRALDASASATFATTEVWPDRVGAYRLNAEIVSMRSGVLEAKLGGVEGDVLTTAQIAASLKPGDIVTIEGYVSPGPRPRAVLAGSEALKLFKAYQAEAPKAPAAKLPWPAAAGLTLLTALVGTYAYLRHQRLQRLALVLSPVDAEEDL